MTPTAPTQVQARTKTNNRMTHEHRTAKVVELIGVSTKSFEDAIQTALNDAEQSIRGITGAHVENLSVKFADGMISEYKANLKVAFGIERTREP